MRKLIYDRDHWIFFILIIFLIIKISIFKFIPLLNDEAYALTISREPSLSYFDHPPLTMWILHFLSEYTSLQNPILFRLPFICFGILTSYFLFLIGRLFYSTNVGIISAILYFFSPFFFFSGGLLIVPDGPLNFFVVSSLYFISKIIFFKNGGSLVEWLVIGVLMALAFLSKYQAYFFGLSLLIYFIFWKKEILISKKFFISFIIASMGLLPVIIWNFNNDFSSFLFHQSRSSFNFHPDRFLVLFLAQLFFILPSTAIVIFINFFYSQKKELKNLEPFFYILAFPPIVFFNLVNFFSGNSFAHWAMIGWMLLIPVCSNFIVSLNLFKWQTYFLKGINVIAVFSSILVILVHSKTGFLTRNKANNFPLPKWDNTKEILNWSNIAEILKNNLNDKELESLVTLNWYYSGQLNTAFSFKYSVGVIGNNDHHFRYLQTPERTYPVLVDIRLLNDINDNFVDEKLDELGYKTLMKTSIPYSRGKLVYGNVKIYKIKRK